MSVHVTVVEKPSYLQSGLHVPIVGALRPRATNASHRLLTGLRVASLQQRMRFKVVRTISCRGLSRAAERAKTLNHQNKRGVIAFPA